MDKKKLPRQLSSDDLRGFEEFLEQTPESPAIDKSSKHPGGEHLTFVLNDGLRLRRVAQLVTEKLPVLREHDQGPKLIEQQRGLNQQLKNELFQLLAPADSPLQRSLGQLWDSFFRGGKL